MSGPYSDCHVLVNRLLLPPKVKGTTRLYLSHQLEVPHCRWSVVLSHQLWLYLDVAHLQKLKTWLLTTNFAIGDHLAIHPREEGDRRAICVCLG